jgi:hypothetical protein
MSPTSNYLTCLGREIHYTGVGRRARRNRRHRDRLARPGAHRARHGRPGRPPVAALARDLPGHDRPRPQPVEPAAQWRNTAWPSTSQLATVAGGPAGRGALPLGGHLDGRRHRPAAAAGALRGRIQRLVLNDIGPSWRPRPSSASAATPAARRPSPPCSELEAYFRTVYKPYGWLSDAQWRRLTETSVRRLPDGRVTPHYDPAMVQQFITTRTTTSSVGAWDSAGPARAVPARRSQRPAAARDGRGHARARPARGGGGPSPAAAMRRR